MRDSHARPVPPKHAISDQRIGMAPSVRAETLRLPTRKEGIGIDTPRSTRGRYADAAERLSERGSHVKCSAGKVRSKNAKSSAGDPAIHPSIACEAAHPTRATPRLPCAIVQHHCPPSKRGDTLITRSTQPDLLRIRPYYPRIVTTAWGTAVDPRVATSKAKDERCQQRQRMRRLSQATSELRYHQRSAHLKAKAEH